MKRILAIVLVCLLIPSLLVMAQDKNSDQEKETAKIKKSIKDLEKRLMKVERKSALDRINFTGDFRFEAHSIQATIPSHFDGMALQRNMVNAMFYYNTTGTFPTSMDDIQNNVRNNYADYLYFTNNLTFDQLKQAMGMFTPEMQQQLFGLLMPSTFVGGYDADNSILYTSRLRLNLQAEVADKVSFIGRLSMYKTWGDSTGVQVFNGQPNTFNIDGNTTGVPNSDVLRVDRAFFTWKDIAGLPMYLSIGRRPSTAGPPMNLRQGELRGGSPMGSLIDFQFDGITLGIHAYENSTIRLCYGLGYESGFGNGEILKQPADRLDDAQFFGANWDVWDTEQMLVQATVARAFNVTDGFNGLVVLPNNPVTGQTIGAPLVMRFTPSANLGDIDIMGLLVQRRDGPLDWFVNYDYMHSSPNNVTTPFGGLFCDPFETPESHDGHLIYVGARYNLNNDKTRIGVEFNHGSKYWFNFTPAQDDIIAPKTDTRGNVVEAYLLHDIYKHFQIKVDFINYDYKYSGSGWHIGAPKKLDAMPLLGFPTYDNAWMVSFSAAVRF